MSVVDLAWAVNLLTEPFDTPERIVLGRFGNRSLFALQDVLRSGLLRQFGIPDWSRERVAIPRFYGVGSDHHCLTVRPHEWLWPLERQATEGFAYFLNAGTASVRLRRSLAFLRALPPPLTASWPGTIDRITVLAEQPTRPSRSSGVAARVDLLIVAERGADKYGAVIEAKFGHDLSENPLGAYVLEASRHGLTRNNCSYLVVGIEQDRIIRSRLSSNRLWRFQGWRSLILALEREMTPTIDDDDYRRFRRTLFSRIH